MIEVTLFTLAVACFIMSFRLGTITDRLNKIQRDIDQMRE